MLAPRTLAQVAGALVVVAALLALLAIQQTDFRGDEYTYVDGARALGAALAGRGSWNVALTELIGTGWFMPGAAVMLAPLFAIVPDAGFLAVRGWMLALNLLLLVAALACFRGLPVRWSTALLLTCPALVAAWHFAAASVLPDVPAGLLSAIALVLAYRIGMGLLAGEAPSLKLLALMELALVAGLYLRGPVIVLVAAVHAVLLVLAFVSAREKVRSSGLLVAGLTAVALALLPWSIAASRHFDARVITTTNFPLVLADSFGDPEKTCFGPCADGVDIWPAWEFAQERAAATGENALTIQREMMAASLDGLTLRSYLQQAREHVADHLFDPAGWVRAQMPVSYRIPPDLRESFLTAITVLSWIIYLPFLLALLAGNLLVARSSDSARLQSVLIKSATFAMMLQPFMHKSGPRYWVMLAPLMAWSVMLLAEMRQGEQSTSGHWPGWLDHMQRAYAAGFVLLAAALLLA